MADPRNVMTEVRNAIAKFLSLPGFPQKGKVLDAWDEPVEKKRRLQFDPTWGESSGKIEAKQTMRYIPGTMDSLAQKMGLASDDPYGLAAKLEAWRRYRK